MTFQTLSFLFGGLLLLIGIVGGGFEVKELKLPNVPPGGRAAATALGLIFVGMAYLNPQHDDNQQPAKPVAVATTSKMSPLEFNTNRWGSDYNHVDLENADPKLCEAECKQDSKCKAWTYVKPGIQNAQARCWLKEYVVQPAPDNCCISGVKLGM
jgi:hypothetical protein